MHGIAYSALGCLAIAGLFTPLQKGASSENPGETLRVGSQGDFDLVTTHKLAVVDADGNNRAVIAALPDGTVGFVMFDGAGTGRFLASINASNEVSTQLADQNSVARVTSLVNAKSAGSILLRDADDQIRVQISTIEEGKMGVVLYKKNGDVSDAFVTN